VEQNPANIIVLKSARLKLVQTTLFIDNMLKSSCFLLFVEEELC